MSRKNSETWGTPFSLHLPLLLSDKRRPSGHAAGGRIVITKMSVSLILTGPVSRYKYQRTLLHFQSSGDLTSPLVTGFR